MGVVEKPGLEAQHGPEGRPSTDSGGVLPGIWLELELYIP